MDKFFGTNIVSGETLQSERLCEVVEELNVKCRETGQDLVSFLEGMAISNFTNYWDYIHVDTLLNLQKPKTNKPDEVVFIVYHQITELMFKLIIHELEQIIEKKLQDLDEAHERLRRIIRHYESLMNSFSTITVAISHDSFLAFRKALFPASGFQSVQFRLIEYYATDLKNLVHHKLRNDVTSDQSIEELYDQLYWQSAGKNNISLLQFNKRYKSFLVHSGENLSKKNLNYLVQADIERIARHDVVNSLRMFDQVANIQWPLAHLKSVQHNLNSQPSTAATTGNTEWRKFLHPSTKKIIFFPALWSAAEISNWGKES